MSTTINQYPFFENNQVLTSSQLNELSGYLDQQTRLSRVRLEGMGIVCGLQPSFTPDVTTPVPSDEGTETISAGTGITSEGYLIHTGQCDLTKRRVYTLPTFADPYLPFIDPATNTQVTLWEMLPDSFIPDPGDPNVPVRITKSFLDGATPGEKMVVLLFLEIVDFDNTSCLAKSCDATGKQRLFTLRKLLCPINEVQIILNYTGKFTLDFPAKFDLPDLKVQRAIYDPESQNTSDYTAFSQQYKIAVSNVYRQNFSDPNGIIKVFSDTYTIFEPILKDIYSNTNPFTPIPNFTEWNTLVNGVNNPSSGPKFLGIQFFYDFIKDLILAYDEFRDSAFDFMSDCCLDMGLFPQHLFLGEAIPVDDCKPSKYRDEFIAVPMTPDQRVAKRRLISNHMRIVLMIRKFNIAIVHKPGVGPEAPVTFITPSLEKIGPLSLRAIPYYYKLNEIDTQLNTTLEAVWDFENDRRCKKDAFGQYPVVAYGNQDMNQNTPIDPIKTPLLYDIDQYDFLRIEGVLRKNVFTTKADLEEKSVRFNLPFKVVAVRLQGGSTKEEILERCNFEDLRSQYVAYRNETVCRVQRLRHYLTVSIGGDKRVIKPLPDFLLQMILDTDLSGKGNSSVAFMPTVFVMPGTTAPAVPHTGVLTYAPRSADAVKIELINTVNLLLARFTTVAQNNLLPTTLDKFDYGYTIRNINLSFINSYIDAVMLAAKVKALLNALLDALWHSTKSQFPQELYFTLSQWASEYFYFLNEFMTDCTFRKLEAVYYNFQYRLNYLLDPRYDPALFKNFVAQHPGLDHKAGTTLGGTYVLVYTGKSVNYELQSQVAFAAILQETQDLKVELDKLEAAPAKSEEETSRMFVIQNKLCEMYATIATMPRPRPRPSGVSTISLALQQIAIGPEDIIADFCLPYLSNCDCDCLSIPAPTEKDLGIPVVILPEFYEYQLGDYAFAKQITGATYGCSTITPLSIDVSKHINYIGTRVASPSFVRLKFVVNGADVPAIASGPTSNPTGVIADRSISVSANSQYGGTVRITEGNGQQQGFLYTPPKNFTGLDSFQYVFEAYDNQGNILRRSTVATVLVSVTTKCPPVKVAATAAFEPIPIGGTL